MKQGQSVFHSLTLFWCLKAILCAPTAMSTCALHSLYQSQIPFPLFPAFASSPFLHHSSFLALLNPQPMSLLYQSSYHSLIPFLLQDSYFSLFFPFTFYSSPYSHLLDHCLAASPSFCISSVPLQNQTSSISNCLTLKITIGLNSKHWTVMQVIPELCFWKGCFHMLMMERSLFAKIGAFCLNALYSFPFYPIILPSFTACHPHQFCSFSFPLAPPSLTPVLVTVCDSECADSWPEGWACRLSPGESIIWARINTKGLNLISATNLAGSKWIIRGPDDTQNKNIHGRGHIH